MAPYQRWDGKADGAEVIIAKRVWTGMNVVILERVTIGENSVIAAGSVVTNDIDANCLAAGNPERKIKSYI